jgi:hypothetical protein
MIELFAGFDVPDQLEFDSINTGYVVSAPDGRFGGGCAISPYFQKTLTSVTTRIIGLAFYADGNYNPAVIQFIDDPLTSVQISINFDSIGRISVVSGSTVLAITTPYFFRVNAWYYLEASVTIGTSGSFEVRLGEQTILSGTGVNTQQTTNNTTNVIYCNFNYAANIDDLYILNTIGDYNNTFLGEQKVLTTQANSDNSIQFSRNTGANNYSNLLTYDGDTSYNYSMTVNNEDLFGMTALGSYNGENFTGNDISATKTVIIARKDDVGERQVANVVVSGSTSEVFTTNTLLSTYEAFVNYMETDPNTGDPWTSAAVNALNIGYKLTG